MKIIDKTTYEIKDLRDDKLIFSGTAVLSKQVVEAAVITGTDLSYAYLRGAVLSNTDLQGANFSNADMTGAYLIMANLVDARFDNADLTDALIDIKYQGMLQSQRANLTNVTWYLGTMKLK